ncbi:hypothetical protein GPL21_33940 [Bradyrhizobium pachyrhizi]|uniref:Uncharacterized protein n=1 Tax=Bradyrhizobium pachyrhizi TaxID=280333 RepID=A0A844SUW1_9BRAD|nr:hypothetical protein [Bradyrhizobium pachyrhizi]MVT70087.1 hypothetical protein [Bradyrhizobium pachyrhizi]
MGAEFRMAGRPLAPVSGGDEPTLLLVLLLGHDRHSTMPMIGMSMIITNMMVMPSNSMLIVQMIS